MTPRFPGRRVATTLKVGGLVVGYAEVPELVVGLTLRDDVEVNAFHIGGQVECLRDLVGGGVERACVTAVRSRNDDVGRNRSAVARRRIDSSAALA